MNPDLQAVENLSETPLQNLLVFRLGAQAFALSIEAIVQVIPMMKLAPLPQSDAAIEGVANIHGKVTPIINLRRRLELPPLPARLHTPIILVRLGNRMAGLLVDEVIDILSLPADQVVHPAEILPEGLEFARIIAGVIFLANHNILLLDPCALVSPAAQALRGGLEAINAAVDSARDSAAALTEPASSETQA